MSQKINFSTKSNSLPQSEQTTSSTSEGSYVICKDDLDIIVGSTTHTSGSSSVATRNITNYPWDQVYIPGNLIAIHCSGNYIAYALQAPQANNGMVRIIHRHTEARGLVKNIKGIVKDLAFSHHTDQILLSFIDHFGTLFVYRIHEESNDLKTELKLNVPGINASQASSEWQNKDYHRVIWCPFIPEDPSQAGSEGEDDEEEGDNDENFAYLLVVTSGSTAEIWHLGSILQLKSGIVERSEIVSGHRTINDHSAPITDAAFSPDGTALATASLDGFVKFFQVYMINDDSTPRCIHQWKPHDGQPLSCLFFLDNHKNPNPDIPFWKFAITGACNNTELKIWSCETWHCHQTLKFEPSPTLQLASQSKLRLKAVIDPSAKFLILSDINRRVLYVLVFNQDSALANSASAALPNGTKGDTDSQSSSPFKHGVHVVSITELPLQYSAIFLTITDASFKHYKKWQHEHQPYNDDHDYDNDEIVEGLVIKCMFINTKSFQEATIRFQPTLPTSALTSEGQGQSSDINISSSQDSIALKDGLSDLSSSIDVDSSLPKKSHSDSPDHDSASAGLHITCSAQSITSSTPTTVFASSKSFNLVTSPVSIGLDAVAALPMNLVTSSDMPSPPQPPHIRQISPPLENSSMVTLLTPDSFSSPRRIEDDLALQNEAKEAVPKAKTPTDLHETLWREKSAEPTISPDPLTSSGEPITIENALLDVISGSSKSPTMDILPPPEIIPSMDVESGSGPLATSELVTSIASESPASFTSPLESVKPLGSVVTPSAPPAPQSEVALGPASSTSSPSLEVQSILNSNEDENVDSDESNKAVEFVSLENEVAVTTPTTTTCLVDLPEPPNSKIEETIKGTLDLFYKSLLEEKASQKKEKQPPLSYSPAVLTPTANYNPAPQYPPAATRSISADASPSYKALHDSHQQSLAALINLKNSATFAPTTTTAVNGEGKSFTNVLTELQFSPHALPSGKNHMTCAQLEAEIRGFTPVRKGQQETPHAIAAVVPASASPSGTSFAPSQDTFRWIPAEKGTEEAIQSLNDKSDKIMEELATLVARNRQFDEKNRQLEERNKTLSAQFEKTLKNLNKINSSVDELRKNFSRHQESQSAQALVASAKPAFESIIRHEIKQALQPAINKYVETLRFQVNTEIRSFSDQLTKSIHSRNFIDNASSTISSTISAQLQNSFREAINKTLLPGFTAVTQQMFSQLNEAFGKGTKEYIQYVEKECQNTRKSFTEHAVSSSRTFEAAAATLSSQGTSLISLTDNLNKVVAKQTSLSEALEDRLRQTLRDELSRSLESARSSRAQTPVPKAVHPPTNPKVQQQQVQQLITQGKINLAFKQALSASDLSIVVFVCERVNPQQLFSQTPCQLSQDVLLSLINQLSHDLSTFTDLKTKYLEEALLNLDKTHPVTMEHYHAVMLSFQRSLSSHMSLHPNHKKLGLLLMAVNHLVGSGTATPSVS